MKLIAKIPISGTTYDFECCTGPKGETLYFLNYGTGIQAVNSVEEAVRDARPDESLEVAIPISRYILKQLHEALLKKEGGQG